MTASNPPPGWYPDPAGSGGVRYWDGRGWTPQARPGPVPQPPPRRPMGVALLATLVAVGLLLALVAWQVIGAVRDTGARTPTAAQASPAAPWPSVQASLEPAPPPSPAQSPEPGPTLSIDDGCAPGVSGRLRTRLTTVTLPAGWVPNESPLSFDCSVSAATDSATGFGDVSLGSVDPTWNLDDAAIAAWAWEDLGVDAPATEQRTSAVVGGRPALVVTRSATEASVGATFDTVVRIAVIDAGRGRREVVMTATSIERGASDPDLLADVEALWAGVRVEG